MIQNPASDAIHLNSNGKRATSGVFLPLTFILVAVAAAAGVAYGTHPDWAGYGFGLKLIMIGRRLEWPLVGVSLIACVGLLGVVVSGKRRIWWLLGLAPVLAMFGERFSDRLHALTASPSALPPLAHYVLEDPAWVDAADPSAAAIVQSGDYVVGVTFDGAAYALPYRALYARPAVQITDFDKRLLVMWSAGANRATAYALARELKTRDLEIVASPVDSLLIYDKRLGQFFSAVTGRTIDHGPVIGLAHSVPTQKLTWSTWRAQHPDTKLLHVDGLSASLPAAPILPQHRLPRVDLPGGVEARSQVAMIATTQPAAISSDAPLREPMNATVGQLHLLIVRDPKTGAIHAFDRKVGDDLFPRFAPQTTRKLPEAAMVDLDSGSHWTIAGKAIDGPLKDQRLRELPVDDILYWGVLKFWFPDITLITPAGAEPATAPAENDGVTPAGGRRSAPNHRR